ncbi:MAG: DNA polymerase I [Spirochaetaceae bacterium]|nr:MAG: DNA polymerase I [Spirochaetaceae bacterium]
MQDTLFLLDGYSLIYRSYFAFVRNPMRNPRGENSSAVFGFVRTLISIFREYEPHRFAVVMDSREPTFRHEKFPEYKANREAAPEDLHAQVPVIEQILSSLGIPIVQAERYEADDLIAALAQRCRTEGMPCRIISGDKDLLQLVHDPVHILRPGKSGLEELDRDGVYRDWQVWPEQILDYLALTGDSSDNVPGVKGIGAKTAAELLSQFETLQGIYDNLERIPSRSRREKLEAGRESAWLSRDLIQLAYDAPIPDDLDTFRLGRIDYAAAAPLLMEQGMRRQVEELGLDPGAYEPATNGERRSDVEDHSALDPALSPRDRTGRVTTASQGEALAGPGEYELVDTLEALDRWIDRARKAGVYAFDVETDSLDPLTAIPAGFSMAVEAGSGCYVPLRGPEGLVLPEEAVRERIGPLLSDDSLTLIGQNFKYDWQVLHQWGIPVPRVAFDTMIAAWLVDTSAGSYGMDRLAREYLGYETVSFSELFEESGEGGRGGGKGGKEKNHDFAQVPLDQAVRYAAEDADITYRLYTVLDKLLDLRGVRELFETIEMPLVPLLASMELEGIGLDVFALEEYSQELTSQIGRIEGEIHEMVGREFNIGSTKQLQEVLFKERKLQPVKKTKTGYSTDNSVLQELAREDPVPEKVLRYRMLTKLRSTYVDALPRMVNRRTGRIHTSFNQTGTATGRLSSTDPNLQNIPIREEEGRRIRNAFIPREGNIFISADYSQIELVILAHLSGDPALREAFTTGEDVHRRTASLIFGMEPGDISSEQRRIAKTINFGVMYGMSAFRLSNELGIPRKDADAFIQAYFGTYSGIRRFIDDTVARVEEEREVRTLLGRPRPIPDINNRNRTVKAGAERVAVNTPIQGTAADIVKKAMLALRARLQREGLKARLILQVHDELILECPREEENAVKAAAMETMSTAVRLSVPLRVSVESGERWGSMHQ